mgnify:CR=1 FL=1
MKTRPDRSGETFRSAISTVSDDALKASRFGFPAQAVFPRAECHDPEIGIIEMQGRRSDMQDTAVTNFCGAGYHLLALFDVQGGADTSRVYVLAILARRLVAGTGNIAQTPEETFVELNDVRARRNSPAGRHPRPADRRLRRQHRHRHDI